MVTSSSSRGFGYIASQSAGYHFEVRHNSDGTITLYERFASQEADKAMYDATPRQIVRISWRRWEMIREPVAAEFNHRLRQQKQRAGRWLKSVTPLTPAFGKELALLAWAIENVDHTVIDRMLTNWLHLAPEERWWFYSMISAEQRHQLTDIDFGWKAAIKVAFRGEVSENVARLPRREEIDVEADTYTDPPTLQGHLFAEPDSPPYKYDKDTP